MEAGTGIEPVFTDLQSNRFPHDINAKAGKSYQDKSGTGGQHDTCPAPGFVTLCAEDLTVRKELAHALAEAIAAAHPDDASQLMTGALIELSAGIPSGAVFVGAEEDARWWASIATPAELEAVLAATLRALGSTALHIAQRKRLFMQLWRSFAPADQASFLSRAKGEV
ncbi:MAG: hypothetical protein K0B00_08255 [Rhodobacteraceae bacterium]|nr:hypothetical protein [Paracoccaceae bacterium]